VTQVFVTHFLFVILSFLFIFLPLVLFISGNIVHVVSTGKEVNVRLEEGVASVPNTKS
jgi:hypothetical protein